jgi:CheY-like chemotaxis protein
VKSILVVDDDREIAELIRTILSGPVWDVSIAADGLEAIRESLRHHIDLIVMDVCMPNFSGLWHCNAFREKSQTSNIPIVLMSGLPDADLAEKARSVGARAFLRKPFRAEDLLQAVRDCLR